MEFPGQAPGGGAVAGRVLSTFRRGCTLGLRGASMASAGREAVSLDWDVRAFFHEGHAMGAAGRAACSPVRQNPERGAAGGGFDVMRYVGYGFWNGVAARYPVPRFGDRASAWSGVASYARYGLLMPNGEGFALALFDGGFTRRVRDRIDAMPDRCSREAAFHGVGRVLWFLYMNNFPALCRILDENGDEGEPLGIGLGLAVAFTQVAAPERILRCVGSFPDRHRGNLIRGAGIALQVHAGNDDECRRRVEGSVSGELLEWYAGAEQASRDAGTGPEWYPVYHELTRRYAPRGVPEGATPP